MTVLLRTYAWLLCVSGDYCLCVCRAVSGSEILCSLRFAVHKIFTCCSFFWNECFTSSLAFLAINLRFCFYVRFAVPNFHLQFRAALLTGSAHLCVCVCVCVCVFVCGEGSDYALSIMSNYAD